jgi:hypothetical protein
MRDAFAREGILSMKDTLALLIAAAVFGVLRFVLPVEGRIEQADIFKDLAHVFVGFAFGYAGYARNRKELWSIAIGLTILEVVAFVVRKQ